MNFRFYSSNDSEFLDLSFLMVLIFSKNGQSLGNSILLTTYYLSH